MVAADSALAEALQVRAQLGRSLPVLPVET